MGCLCHYPALLAGASHRRTHAGGGRGQRHCRMMGDADRMLLCLCQTSTRRYPVQAVRRTGPRDPDSACRRLDRDRAESGGSRTGATSAPAASAPRSRFLPVGRGARMGSGASWWPRICMSRSPAAGGRTERRVPGSARRSVRCPAGLYFHHRSSPRFLTCVRNDTAGCCRVDRVTVLSTTIVLSAALSVISTAGRNLVFSDPPHAFGLSQDSSVASLHRNDKLWLLLPVGMTTFAGIQGSRPDSPVSRR